MDSSEFIIICDLILKTGHNSAFIEIHFIAPSFYCTIMFNAMKAFFCSNIKSVLQSNSFQASGTCAIHGFVYIPMMIKITYTVIIYDCAGIQS